MIIPGKYFLTPKISELLSQIEANKEVVNSVSIPKDIEINIRRKSSLKSSLYSARIEGNTTTFDELSKIGPKTIKRIEIDNVLRGLNYISERKFKKISMSDILTLHKIVMQGLANEVGKFRKTHEGIFTTTGAVIYHAPPPSLILGLISRLLKYINSDKERFIPIKAALTHYSFEKIHPFIDGSGRVGRLLLLATLKNGGYDFKGILPFEEKIDSHREVYYRMLEEPERDLTNYIEFILETVKEASGEAKKLIIDSRSDTSGLDSLLPRRAEILNLVKDHKIINFDSIKRRFNKINDRTLRYDIKKLCDSKLIIKLGTTRGVYYTIAKH